MLQAKVRPTRKESNLNSRGRLELSENLHDVSHGVRGSENLWAKDSATCEQSTEYELPNVQCGGTLKKPMTLLRRG